MVNTRYSTLCYKTDGYLTASQNSLLTLHFLSFLCKRKTVPEGQSHFYFKALILAQPKDHVHDLGHKVILK